MKKELILLLLLIIIIIFVSCIFSYISGSTLTTSISSVSQKAKFGFYSLKSFIINIFPYNFSIQLVISQTT